MPEMTIVIDPAYECNDGRIGAVVAAFEYVRPTGTGKYCEGLLNLDDMNVEFIWPNTLPAKRNCWHQLTPGEQLRLINRARAVAQVWFNCLMIGGTPCP